MSPRARAAVSRRARAAVSRRAALLLVALAACRAQPSHDEGRGDQAGAAGDPIVATVAGEPIHLSEIEPHGPTPRDANAVAVARRHYLDNAIATRLMRLEAARLRLSAPDEHALFDALRAQEVDAKVVVTDADLAAELAAHADRYPRHPRVRLRQVFVPLAAEASPAQVARASRGLRDRVAADLRRHPAAEIGEDLGVLSYRLGDDPTGEGILSDPAVRAVAATMTAGAVSPVVRSAAGLHVLLCLDSEPQGPATLEDARPRLEQVVRARLRSRAEDAWMAELRTRYAVELFPSVRL